MSYNNSYNSYGGGYNNFRGRGGYRGRGGFRGSFRGGFGRGGKPSFGGKPFGQTRNPKKVYVANIPRYYHLFCLIGHIIQNINKQRSYTKRIRTNI